MKLLSKLSIYNQRRRSCTKPSIVSSSDNAAIDHATKMITTENLPHVKHWVGIMLQSVQCPVTRLNTHLTFHLFERRASGTPGTGSWALEFPVAFDALAQRFSSGARLMLSET